MKTKAEKQAAARTKSSAGTKPSLRLLAAYKDKALVVIPARYGSTRFEGKPLARIAGVPMIVHVMNRAAKIRNADAVIVATDDERIKSVVEEAGGVAVMTKRTHPTGTSRVCEAAGYFLHGIVVNVQGDEPLLPVRAVENLIAGMQADPLLGMGTLASPASDFDDLFRGDVVKVVCERRRGRALFFEIPDPVPAVRGRGGTEGGPRGLEEAPRRAELPPPHRGLRLQARISLWLQQVAPRSPREARASRTAPRPRERVSYRRRRLPFGLDRRRSPRGRRESSKNTSRETRFAQKKS